jgi:hypothetical protein
VQLIAGFLEPVLGNIHQRHRDTGPRQTMGDAAAHQAGADHAHPAGFELRDILGASLEIASGVGGIILRADLVLGRA